MGRYRSPDRNVTAPALLRLKCDISTSSALLPIPTRTGKHEPHSYTFAQPLTAFVLIKPCLKSTKCHKLSSSSEAVSSPSLEEAVVLRPTADGGRQGQSTARVLLPVRSPCSLSCETELLPQAQAGHKTALTPDKFIIRLLFRGIDIWFKLLSQHTALKPSRLTAGETTTAQ